MEQEAQPFLEKKPKPELTRTRDRQFGSFFILWIKFERGWCEILQQMSIGTNSRIKKIKSQLKIDCSGKLGCFAISWIGEKKKKAEQIRS